MVRGLRYFNEVVDEPDDDGDLIDGDDDDWDDDEENDDEENDDELDDGV